MGKKQNETAMAKEVGENARTESEEKERDG